MRIDLIDLISSLLLRQYTMLLVKVVAMMKMIKLYKDEHFMNITPFIRLMIKLDFFSRFSWSSMRSLNVRNHSYFCEPIAPIGGKPIVIAKADGKEGQCS